MSPADDAVPHASRLPTVHAARGFAALMVMAMHVTMKNGFLGDMFFAGGHGVDLFFVISGFVMMYAHDGEHGPRAAWRFCQRRLVRIFPPYWIIAAAAWWGGYSYSYWQPLPAVFLYHQDRDPILQQAWTLSMELAFYTFFLASFFVRRSWFLVLSAGWVGMVAWNYIYPWDGGMLLYTRNVEFFCGVLGAIVVLRWRGVAVSGLWVLAAMVLLCATFYFNAYGQLPPYYDVWNYAAPCTLLIVSGALWDISRRPRYPRWIMTLGDASYVLYLMHYVERDGLHYVLLQYPALFRYGNDIAVVGGCVVIVLSAVLFHRCIERPVVRWCNRVLALSA